MHPRSELPGKDLAQEALVTVDEIRAAAERLRGITVRTPLLPFGPPLPGDPRGAPRAWLKPESLQRIGSFKLRGAYNAIVQLPAEVRHRGVVAASSGNHAQGVSGAARLLGIPAVIVMPSDASRTKVAAVGADGARMVFVGPTSEERIGRARAIAEEEGLALIPSYDHRDVIAGQGTAGLEIVEQMAELDQDGDDITAASPFTVLVPIGGGGLASGVATAVKALRPGATVLGVEPSLAADARESMRAGRIVSWAAEDVARTSADGMRTMSLGKLTFAHLHARLDGVLVVEEDEIGRAMLRAARDARLVLEPSGATSLAAWLFHHDKMPPGRVVCLLSGGNVDPAVYRTVLDRAQAHEASEASTGEGDRAAIIRR